MSKPAIVIIPGAFHDAKCMDSLVAELATKNLQAEAHTLRTVENPTKDLADDASFIRDQLMRHINAGRDVFLVVHSLAGFPGSAAMAGIDKASRRAVSLWANGVVGVLFLAAFVPAPGLTAFDMMGGQFPPWMVNDVDTGLVSTRDETATFYADCKPDVAKRAVKDLARHSAKAFNTPPMKLGWQEEGYNGKRAYLQCLDDQALPIQYQRQFTEGGPEEWTIRTLKSSHSPFLSMPLEVADVIEQMIGELPAN